MTHIVLVGSMGAGKSTVGGLLAARLGRELLDNDVLLLRRTGRRAADMPDTERHRAEREVLAEALAHPSPAVVTAAASVADDPDAVEMLGRHTVLWLDARADVLAPRALRGDHRPIDEATARRVLDVLARRRSGAYSRVASAVVATDDVPAVEVADRVVAWLAGGDPPGITARADRGLPADERGNPTGAGLSSPCGPTTTEEMTTMGADDQARQRVSDETKAAERRDAQVKAGPDRMPTEEEERVAEEQDLDDDAAESYKDAIERGAAAKGEGRIP